jgi:hypothetical protein
MARPFERVRHGAWDVAEDVRLLTYDEIASLFGITRESARQLVIRKRWGRTKGNDNRARIEVPEDAITGASTSDAPSHDTGHDPSDDTSERTGESPSDFAAVVAVLERHAGRLEAELAAARSRIEAVEGERDAERAKASQVAVLEAVLEIERTRLAEARADADRSRAEADRWREAATAPRGMWATLLKRFG